MMRVLTVLAALFISAGAYAGEVAAWNFDTKDEAAKWVANGQLANVVCKGGILSADTTDWDPFFTYSGPPFKTSAWQCVVIRIRASKPGEGQLFWSGTSEGAYGGFSEGKTTRFKLTGAGAWEEAVLFPFWQKEGSIKLFRFDLYDGAHFDIDSIRVLDWGEGVAPTRADGKWEFGGDLSAWRVHPSAASFFAPPLQLDTADKNWATVRLSAKHDGVASLLWAKADSHGEHAESFAFDGDGEIHSYNIELQGGKSWQGSVVAFGIRLPKEEAVGVRVESIVLADRPSGPADVQVTRLGFANAINRAERDCKVLVQLANRGGAKTGALRAELALPDGVTLVKGAAAPPVAALDFDDRADLSWTLRVARPGNYAVRLNVNGLDAPLDAETVLSFVASLPVKKMDYVPEPKPVATDMKVLAYYFPGWNADVKWDCIRDTAPVRKPLLGYYDEGDSECVDWQIKWAAENGIHCFLVDWYWSKGGQHLTHWFEAYREARYRDHLKVAIMWANHNSPGSHSVEDWRKVTREWIDKYFNLKTYYLVDGKPAVYIWSPDNIRRDLGGSEVVRKSFDESQEMAKAAGYEGIAFISMRVGGSLRGSEVLAQEGYSGSTTYHEWGDAVNMSPIPKRARYEDVAATVGEAWARNEETSGPLEYYPVVDTGWDSRPWHGSRALAIEGRTADLFEKVLRDAKAFAKGEGKDSIILGPLNEWGEGSYIEPCTEFGFDMYERLRKVFATGDPASWPVNVAPQDVGRGPYDYARGETRTFWTFDKSLGNWQSMMGVADLRAEGGAMQFRTTSDDPALLLATPDLEAGLFPQLVIRVSLTIPGASSSSGQVFWTSPGKPTSEAASVSFATQPDGKEHVYRVPLANNPRWRGKITAIRLDLCNKQGVDVSVSEIRFEK